ncbi:MAG: hypothetical protein NC826_05025 [Candidatus Omnitrophica bacterium]|nr:hypothetical protein [Candidatus Omnitrophota bacterium]
MGGLLLTRRAQSTLEYAIIISAVIAGLAIMGIVWFRGAYQGRLKSASDEIGEQFDTEATYSSYTTRRNSNTLEQVTGSGITTTTTEDVYRSGSDVTDAFSARKGK